MTRKVRESELEAMRARAERAEKDLATANSRLMELERENVSLLRDVKSEEDICEIRAEAVEKAASEFLAGVDAGNKDETAAYASVRVYKLLKKIREGKE